MIENEIKAILQQTIGFNITAIGQSTLERAINNRISALGITSHDKYIARLKSSKKEVQELIEEVVIPETWFFRDQEPFNAMIDYANEYLRNADGAEHLRILSIPCSTGEEPYSIVMALCNANWPKNMIHVDAVDISHKAITYAQHAEYSQKSFRGTSLNFQGKYFQKKNNLYVLHNFIRQKVNFMHGNILNPIFMQRLGVYHIIFCRNVLIYLDSAHQDSAIKALARLLSSQGLLITGHAEAGMFINRKEFLPVSHSRSFAFYKNYQPPKRTPVRSTSGSPAITQQSSIKTDTASSRRHFPAIPQSPVSSARSSQTDNARKGNAAPDLFNDLNAAKNLADRGFLAEADALCEKIIQQHGPVAQVYYLLGVIRDFEDRTEDAIKLLKKTLYLEPEHLDSLILLSYLSEKKGALRDAENYRRRAMNLQTKETIICPR